MRIKLNRSEIERLLRSPTGPVWRHVEELARETTNAAKRRAPVDHGKLRASIHYTIKLHGKRVVGRISTPLVYGLWQHEGTGIYGPKGRPIRPKKAGVLVFQPKGRGPARRGQRGGRGGVVFAREVKGTPPNPYLVDALESVSPYPVTRDSRR